MTHANVYWGIAPDRCNRLGCTRKADILARIGQPDDPLSCSVLYCRRHAKRAYSFDRNRRVHSIVVLAGRVCPPEAMEPPRRRAQ